MPSRRDFLGGAAAVLAGALVAKARVGAAPSTWAPYRDTLTIDGQSMLSLLYAVDAEADRKELERLRPSGLGAAMMDVGPSGRFWLNDAAYASFKDTAVAFKKKIDEHKDALLLVDNAADLRKAHREKRCGVIFKFQGTEPLGEDPERITEFRKLGLRVIQLTHNRRNLVGDGCVEPSQAGLSRFGYAIVECLNDEKIVVDLAHGAPRTIGDGIKASKAPVLISHTGCRALADLPRNTSDEHLRAMADRGGVAGIIFWPYLRTDTQPMAIDVVRHIEHAINVCGEDHVGIGTDTSIGPIERTPAFEKENREMIARLVASGVFARGRPADLYMFIPDLNMLNRFEVLAAMLSARGHSDARIAKILGGNFARVLGDVLG
jgi:membrane dipeptidase